jgi:hypothetical protein
MEDFDLLESGSGTDPQESPWVAKLMANNILYDALIISLNPRVVKCYPNDEVGW